LRKKSVAASSRASLRPATAAREEEGQDCGGAGSTRRRRGLRRRIRTRGREGERTAHDVEFTAARHFLPVRSILVPLSSLLVPAIYFHVVGPRSLFFIQYASLIHSIPSPLSSPSFLIFFFPLCSLLDPDHARRWDS
jgi:hypothetical protein